MKKITCLMMSALTLCLTSCIKDEALNAECDIVGVDSTWLAANSTIMIGAPILTNDYLSFNIQKGSDRSALAPKFYLTPGATITATVDGVEVPGNGLVRDFVSPQQYVVHSEDGNWHKTYTVAFNYPKPITTCSFEHFALESTGRYYQWFEIDELDEQNPRRDCWGTGNAGYALTGMGKQPSDYPSAPYEVGVRGNCVKLVTRDTGSFGEGTHMPIAAGNLFIGEFRASQAMLFPRKATRFGLQLAGGEPIWFSGFYKYTAGEVFTDGKKNVCPERHDTCDIYAVLYEVDPAKFEALNGDNVLSSSRIVSLARIAEPGEPQEWTFFKEPFMVRPGKVFSEERLRNDGYAIAIVASSSREGHYFEGAVGSTLYIDELRITWRGEAEPTREEYFPVR